MTTISGDASGRPCASRATRLSTVMMLGGSRAMPERQSPRSRRAERRWRCPASRWRQRTCRSPFDMRNEHDEHRDDQRDARDARAA